jgi:hypothetical protein
MCPGIPGVRHQLVDWHLFKSLRVHLHSLSRSRSRRLHHVVLRIRAAVLCGAVFFHDLEDLVPQAVCLIHVVDSDVDERRRDRLPGCRMLGEVSELGRHFFALNPSRRAHRVALQQLRRHGLGYAELVKPFPGLAVDVGGLQSGAVMLPGR